MVETKLKAGYELIKVFNAIGHITDEAMLYFKPSGLEIRETDNSGISMLSVAMQPSQLTEYVANQEVKAGINLENLNKMLKTLPKGAEFTLSITDISLDIKAQNKAFKVPLIEHTPKIDREPPVEFSTIIRLNTLLFRDILKDLSAIGTIAHINTNSTNISFDAEGDAGSINNQYDNLIIKSTEPITNLCFNIAEMQKLIKEADKKSDIELYLKNGEALKVVYELAGQKLRGFLAPYMESEDA
jgi:proliferating cell nuclear antigen PCNA